MEGSVAGSVAVVAGRRILTRHLVAVAGVVAALPTRTLVAGRRPAWSSSKRLPTQKGAEHHSIRVLKLPNPYAQDGGRTPGWGGPSARTPNPYTAPNKGSAGSGWGGATPGWGGATPKPPSSSGNDSSSAPINNGWASPGPASSGGWGGESSWVSLPDVSRVHSLHPTERTDARFWGSDARVRAYPWGTRLRINSVQCTDPGRNVC
jgi:hypothetical protein